MSDTNPPENVTEIKSGNGGKPLTAEQIMQQIDAEAIKAEATEFKQKAAVLKKKVDAAHEVLEAAQAELKAYADAYTKKVNSRRK